MKKLFYLLGILLFILPTAMAQLEIDRLKIYVNDARQIILEDITEDTDGGIIKDVQAGDIIEYQLRLKNGWNQTINVEIRAVIEDIDNGDNLAETIDFDLGYEEEITKKISFTIPSEVRVDNYYSIIEITGEIENYSNPDFSIEFEIDVISGEKEGFNLVSSFDNLTGITAEYIKRLDERGKTVEEYVDKVEHLEWLKGGLEKDLENCKADLDVINIEKESWINEKSAYERDYIRESICNVKIEEAKKENDWFLPAGIIFIIWYFWIRKKKGEEDEKVGESSEDRRFRKY